MLMKLRHPNILTLIGIVNEHPNLAIITDFIPNGDLYNILHKRK